MQKYLATKSQHQYLNVYVRKIFIAKLKFWYCCICCFGWVDKQYIVDLVDKVSQSLMMFRVKVLSEPENFMGWCCTKTVLSRQFGCSWPKTVKVKLGLYAIADVALLLISVPLAFEPVVGENSLPWDTGSVHYLGCLSSPYPGFPR